MTRRVTLQQARDAASRLGIDWSRVRFAVDDLRDGMQVELEHTRSLTQAARIALDHLRELPDYYERLRFVEQGGPFPALGNVPDSQVDLGRPRPATDLWTYALVGAAVLAVGYFTLREAT